MTWDVYKINIYSKWKKIWYDTHPFDVAEYSWNYLFTGGKEIRSKLFCELWKYLCPDLEINAELAFSIECIHVASLVLDDTPWMDNANERRGSKTLHIVFSPKKALLIANDILSIALNIWKNNKPLHIDEDRWKFLLISKLQRFATGQWLDLIKGGTLTELASLKTGVLFELVAETVALCTQLDSTFWRSWGNNLGILFQWVDDWIDRKEDIEQNNRNAFNEGRDTLSEYIHIWILLERNIGKQWFDRPFGIFMKKYFIDQLHITCPVITRGSLRDIIHDNTIPLWTTDDNKCNQYLCSMLCNLRKYVSNYTYLHNFIKNIDDEIIMERIFYMTRSLFEISGMTNLWNIDENKWESYIFPTKIHEDQYSYIYKWECDILTTIPIMLTNDIDYEKIMYHCNNSMKSHPIQIWTNDNWKPYIQYIQNKVINQYFPISL